MVIVMITGTLGSGKTLYMTKLLKEKQERGHNIYSNYNLNFPFNPLTKDAIKNYGKWDYDKCVIGIDELQIMLDSRTSMTAKNRIMSYWFMQTRKRNVYLIFTTQYPDQCEKRLRRLVDIWIECSKIKRGNKIYIFTKTWYMGVKKQKKPIRNIILANDYFDAYDTKEIIKYEEW